VTDHPAGAKSPLQADFRELGGFSGTGLTAYDNHGIANDGLANLVSPFANRKRFRQGDG
jgi:hypothetical protein